MRQPNLPRIMLILWSIVHRKAQTAPIKGKVYAHWNFACLKENSLRRRPTARRPPGCAAGCGPASWCPRACKVDRLAGERGYCRAAEKAVVNTAQLHPGEEPPISGHNGSGTVFFAGCTLGCRFCQNYQISQEGWGQEISDQQLAGVFLELQNAGAHNINLVTPTPHLAAILEALAIAREQGLAIPIVYNTSGYERAAAIRALAGLIEIYMPDFKYADDQAALRLSDAKDYVRHASASLEEMFSQVGNLQFDENGVTTGGVLVRHLVLPNGLAGTKWVLGELVRICGKKRRRQPDEPVFPHLQGNADQGHRQAHHQGRIRRGPPGPG